MFELFSTSEGVFLKWKSASLDLWTTSRVFTMFRYIRGDRVAVYWFTMKGKLPDKLVEWTFKCGTSNHFDN
jgi:hypothetical protein